MGKPTGWERFEQVNVDMSDVLGTPGVPQHDELAERLTSKTGSAWAQMATSQTLFLAGRSEAAPAIGSGAVGAFGASAAPVVEELNQAAASGPGSGTVFANDDVVIRLRSASGRHVVGHQRVRGAEIVGARYRVHTDERGNVAITGRPLGDVAARDPGPRPAVPAEEAARGVRAQFDVPPDVRIPVDMVVFPLGGGGVWAFEARFKLDDPVSDVRAFVRADDLSLLVSYNVASSSLFGEASVFPVNPRRTPDPVTVRLEGLGPDPSDQLIGLGVDVRPSQGARLVNASRDCRLAADRPGFDEASAFYHLSGAVRWAAGILGSQIFTAAPFVPLKVMVGHRPADGDAFFLPSTGEIVLGGGPRPAARSAEVLYHEFGHALADAICRLNRSPVNQAKGLSEGYGDYVAASAFDDPRFGDWMTGRPRGARNCSDTKLAFPVGWEGEEHRTGAAWAAVLWAIRSGLGREITDLVVLESLQFLGPLSTFEDGRAALVRVDRSLFPGAGDQGRHEDVI
ncbi:MAG: hypothetical protein ACRD0F_05640, partial [Acidimicrobiales bacterium]